MFIIDERGLNHVLLRAAIFCCVTNRSVKRELEVLAAFVKKTAKKAESNVVSILSTLILMRSKSTLFSTSNFLLTTAYLRFKNKPTKMKNKLPAVILGDI